MRRLPLDYAVRNLGRSLSRTALSCTGAFLVVLLVLAAAAFARGMESSLATPRGGEDNVILLGAGSEESLERSELQAAAPGTAAASIPGIRERLGVAYVSPEIVFASEAEIEAEGGDDGGRERVFATFRGIEEPAYLVHGAVRVVEGRAPGPDEVMVGRLAPTRAGVAPERMAVGRTVWLDDRPFTVSGVFEAPGTVLASEIWMPLGDLRVTTRRDTLSSVVLTLGPDGEFEDVDLFTKQRLDLELVALREREYHAGLFRFYAPIRWMVWVTAVLVGLGAFLGGLNTAYASFGARIRELATLQSLGYSRAAIVLSLIQESLLTASVGGLAAAVIGVALLDGLAVNVSMGAFGLVVDAQVVLLALGTGFVLGIVGAIPPAVRCLTPPVAEALRA